MTYLIDTHSHLYDAQFEGETDALINRCIENNISKILLPNINLSTLHQVFELTTKYPDNCYGMVGLHPCDVNENYEIELKKIYISFIDNYLKKTIAIGEIGLDLYWDKSTYDIQKKAFEIQLNWAQEHNLPVSIHSRESTHHIIEIIKNRKIKTSGVFHCFSGSFEQAREIINLGMYLGIGGVVTYKNSNLPETLKKIDISNIVLETDSPYLPPVPYRGKRNESSYITEIAKKISEIYQISYEEVCMITTNNATQIFNVGS